MARHQRLSLEAADFLSFLSFFVVLLLTAVFKCISRFFPFEPNVSDGCQMLIERLHRKLRRPNDSVDRIEQPSQYFANFQIIEIKLKCHFEIIFMLQSSKLSQLQVKQKAPKFQRRLS